MWKLRLECTIRGCQKDRRSQRAVQALGANMRLQSCPCWESTFSGDCQLRIVQRRARRRRSTRVKGIEATKRLRFVRSDGLQQRARLFAVMFEIEAGQRILLLCLCPLSRPKEVRRIAYQRLSNRRAKPFPRTGRVL
jgi:hypothetical protein